MDRFWLTPLSLAVDYAKSDKKLMLLKKIKGLEYSIDSVNHFTGIPFFRKLRKVQFLISDKEIAEFIVDKNQYEIKFSDSDKIKIYCENEIGSEFKITDLANTRTWTFSNPNKNFSLLKKSPEYLMESSNTSIGIDIKNSSMIYSINQKIIGRIEDKNILFKNGTNIIDVFDEKYKRVLISACCVELIRYHILKVYEPND